MNDRDLKEALDFDPLDTAERMLDCRFNKEEAVPLGFFLMRQNSEKKEIALRERFDSYWANPLLYYFKVLEKEGFERVLTTYFLHEEEDGKHHDTFYIYWKASEGLLLKFDTWHGRLNGGTVYFNLQLNEESRYFPPNCSGSIEKDGLLPGDFDCREAIRFQLQRMREMGTFLPVWKKQKFLWLLHHQDTKIPNYDYKAITQKRIAQLPQEVQDAIRGEE